MDRQQLAVAVGDVVNHAPRPPALKPIAYIKYPAREIRPVLIQDGSWRVSLALWGYEYKHRGPRPKNSVSIDGEKIKHTFNLLLPDGLSVCAVEAHRENIEIFLKENRNMKLLVLMCFILIVAGICVWSCCVVCKENGFGPWAKKTAINEFQESKALYFNYAADYANFSEIVWCCAQAVGSSGNLMPPSEPRAIFCQRVSERISMANGRITFAYEIPLGASGLLKRAAIRPKYVQKQYADLEAAFLGRLPDYLRGGYFFLGGVSVFNAGRNCIRVEIHGVDRNIPIQPEEFII